MRYVEAGDYIPFGVSKTERYKNIKVPVFFPLKLLRYNIAYDEDQYRWWTPVVLVKFNMKLREITIRWGWEPR